MRSWVALQPSAASSLVALDDDEAESLRSLQARAVENGLTGVRLVGPPEMAEIEPYVHGVLGLHSPTTAVVDFRKGGRGSGR